MMIRTRPLSACFLVLFITPSLAISSCTATEQQTFRESATGSSSTIDDFTDTDLDILSQPMIFDHAGLNPLMIWSSDITEVIFLAERNE